MAYTPGSCSHLKEIAKPGDVIFISLGNHPFYQQVERAMNHWSGHVGLILKNTQNDLYITESTYPFSKDTEFCQFVNKAKGKVAIRRLKNVSVTEDENQELINASQKRLGIYYHLGFDFDSQKQFCSKFVYEVMQEVLNVEVGSIETFQQLLDSHPNPQDREAAVSFFEAWFFRWAIPGIPNIPWERRTITPKSQYEDIDLYTVYSWTN